MLFLLLRLLILMMPSTPCSFRTLPKAMLKLPMMTPTVLRPLLKIPRELFASLELLDVAACQPVSKPGKKVPSSGVWPLLDQNSLWAADMIS